MLVSRQSFLLVFATILAVFVGTTTEATAARKARATGFYRPQKGAVVIPLQFVLSGPGMTGNHSLPIGFPNDDPMIDGDVTLIGNNPAAIQLPQGIVSGSYSALLPLMGTSNIQIQTSFSVVQAPANTMGALFSSMGGPGPFSFCPGSNPGTVGAACPVTSMGGPNLTAPPQGTGTRNGRIVYLGGSGFGGVSQVFLVGGGVSSRPRSGFNFGSAIFQAGGAPFGGSGNQPAGGSVGFYSTVMLGGALYSQPKTAPTTMATISSMQFGPQVTSMNALTSCPSTSMGGAYPNIPLTGSLACVVGTGPVLVAASATTTNSGFPFTTGTVLAQQTTATQGGVDFFTLTGSDARTTKGIGNITLVAGGLAIRNNIAGVQAGAQADTISLTISEKAPSMSGAGLTAAAVLMVLVAGHFTRRRF